MTIGVGFHKISKLEYLSDPCERPSLTATVAKAIIRQSPSHGWDMHPRNPAAMSVGKDPTEAMRRGLTVDSLVFGADQEIVILPSEMLNAKGEMQPTRDAYSLKSAQEWRDLAVAEGKLPVKVSEFDECSRVAKAIMSKLPDASGDDQVVAVWEDANKVLCRCRFDRITIEETWWMVRELKTVENAAPWAVNKAFENYGWDIQHAAYTEAVETLRPDLAGRGRVQFIFAEGSSPFAVRMPPMSGMATELGRRRWARAKRLWKEGLDTGEWRSYGDDPIEASASALEREMLNG